MRAPPTKIARARFAETLFRLQTRADVRDYREAHRFLTSGLDLAQGLADALGLYGPRGARVVAMAKALCDFEKPEIDGGLPMRTKTDLVRAVEAFARDPGLPKSRLQAKTADG
ncbi:MAG: hypothetical protein O9277_15580 [Magnetospirillum sp.]|nr:hypothetical protein [Magnetospirillum sp.]